MKRSGLILVVCLFTIPLFAQTSGGIVGKITDATGAALPGVTVEAKSPSLQGTRATVSDSEGGYRFALLPPGQYSVRFDLSGFAPLAHNVVVSLGKDSTLDAAMRLASVTAEVTVSAEAPVLDTTSTTLGTNLSTRAIETLPTGRNYASIVQVAPGVSSDANTSNSTQSTISVYGSSGAENAFYIDGVNTTNMEYGFQGKELNFEFISEVDVKTGGYEAEFGRSTSGFVNVVTKSGTNDLKGTFHLTGKNDSLSSNPKNPDGSTASKNPYHQYQTGFTLGGPIIRDQLFYFAAGDFQKAASTKQQDPNRIEPAVVAAFASLGSPGENLPIERTNDAHVLLAKADWDLTAKNLATLRYNYTWSEQKNGTFDVDSWGRSANATEKDDSNALTGALVSTITS